MCGVGGSDKLIAILSRQGETRQHKEKTKDEWREQDRRGIVCVILEKVEVDHLQVIGSSTTSTTSTTSTSTIVFISSQYIQEKATLESPLHSLLNSCNCLLLAIDFLVHVPQSPHSAEIRDCSKFNLSYRIDFQLIPFSILNQARSRSIYILSLTNRSSCVYLFDLLIFPF